MKLLSVGKAAEKIAMSPSTVRWLCDTGRLPSVRPTGPNGHRRIAEEDIDNYLRSISVGGEAITNHQSQSDDLADAIRRVKGL